MSSYHIFSQLKCRVLENCLIIYYYKHCLLFCNASKFWRFFQVGTRELRSEIGFNFASSQHELPFQSQKQAHQFKKSIARFGIITGNMAKKKKWELQDLTKKFQSLAQNKHNYHNVTKPNQTNSKHLWNKRCKQGRHAQIRKKRRGGSPTKILKLLILYDSIMDKENSLL